jgi:hypothetical protein
MNSPHNRELMRLHVCVLFTHDARSRLLRVNEPTGGGPAPRFFLGRTREGNLWRVRADLPETLIAELESLAADEPVGELEQPPRHSEAYLRLLASHAPTTEPWTGPAYHFTRYPQPTRPVLAVTSANADVLRGGFEKLMADVAVEQPFVAIVEAGLAVSVCRSVRVTPEAHEAGLETLPEFRGRGLAAKVVAGWALAVRSRGALPIYSTSWRNTASRAVARKLGLIMSGIDFHAT